MKNIFLEMAGLYTESYYGKTATLSEMELVLDKLIPEIKNGNIKNPNGSNYNTNLEHLICKQFGFKKTLIKWTICKWNVTTLVSTHILFDAGRTELLSSKKNGYYDKSHKNICLININIDMIKELDFTSQEVVGIFLHEIGHNFDYSVYNTLNIIFEYLKAKDKLGAFAIGEVLKSAPMKTYTDMLLTVPSTILMLDGTVQDITSGLTKFFRGFSRIMSYVTAPIGLLTLPVVVITAPIIQLLDTFKSGTEQFADSFSVAYGYSVDLNSALEKISRATTISQKTDVDTISPILRVAIDISTMRYEFVSMVGSPYGHTQSRMKRSIEILHEDLKELDDPRMIAELKDDIEEMEKMYTDYIGLDEDAKLSLTKSLRQFFDNTFGGIPQIGKLYIDNKAI